ncbi:MAG: hypothetical protein PHG20_12555, partial [Geobacteraceae bacterium]|nr:hypothetical protein [Geobacteraceae bacterium]
TRCRIHPILSGILTMTALYSVNLRVMGKSNISLMSVDTLVSSAERLLMMHKGEIVRDLGGEAKKRLRPDDLLAHFDQVRRREMLDESAAAMLREQYI